MFAETENVHVRKKFPTTGAMSVKEQDLCSTEVYVQGREHGEGTSHPARGLMRGGAFGRHFLSLGLRDVKSAQKREEYVQRPRAIKWYAGQWNSQSWVLEYRMGE